MTSYRIIRSIMMMLVMFICSNCFLQNPSLINRKFTTNLKVIDEQYFNRPGIWDEKNLDSLFEANKAWAKRMVTQNPDFFEDHKKGHAPKILWIGCSDARVPANEIIGEPPGSVFVHRNIANMVVNTDFNCMSVIQYAVDVLQVKHIIVCGHYDCGGVKAALTNTDHRSPLENWLRNIRDTYRLHKDELDEIEDATLRQRRLVELNVIEQCLNIFKTAVVQRKRVETHLSSKDLSSGINFSTPRIHAFVYEPTTGKATKLRVDFATYLKDLRSVYDLYQIPPKAIDKVNLTEAIRTANTESILISDTTVADNDNNNNNNNNNNIINNRDARKNIFAKLFIKPTLKIMKRSSKRLLAKIVNVTDENKHNYDHIQSASVVNKRELRSRENNLKTKKTGLELKKNDLKHLNISTTKTIISLEEHVNLYESTHIIVLNEEIL